MRRIAGLALLLAASPLAAQEPAAAEPGTALRVWLVTVGQGDRIWEKFGHNMLWIRDESRGVDVAYNWGMFSFDQPGFVGKLLRGRMQYWMGGFDAVAMANAYVEENRTIWRQELNLTPGQRIELVRFLAWNDQPENRFYRYDYYRDNCSTRVRDALDRVMGGELKEQLEAIRTAATYRSHTQRLTADRLAESAGLLLAMGHSVDAPLTAWDEGFIPMQLMEHLRSVTVPRPGGPAPLVLSETTVFEATRPPERAAAPDRRLPFTLAGLALGALLLGLGRAARRRAPARAAWFGAALAWSIATGVPGTVITLLWAATDHTDTYRNENVLQAGPFSLLLAVLLALAASGRAERAARTVAAVVAGLAGAGLLLQILPGLDQPNGAIIGLLLPVHAALAVSLAGLPGRRGSASG